MLTYNVWLIPSARDRAERAPLIATAFGDADAIILSEVFDADGATEITNAATRRGYHATSVLGHDVIPRCEVRLGPLALRAPVALNGGVMIVSRTPIRKTESLYFGREACTGEDCCAAKGALYAQVDLPRGRVLHLFGAHLQNPDPMIGADAKESRTKQLHMLRRFMDRVLENEERGPVLVGGDLNVPREELEEALTILRVPLNVAMSGGPSWGRNNSYSEDDEGEGLRLDYVLPTNDYDPPREAENITGSARGRIDASRGLLGLRSEERDVDLSDHHPVVGRFRW